MFLRLYLHSLEASPEAPPSQIPPSQASANPQLTTSPEAPPSQIPPSQASANPQLTTSPEAPPSQIPPSQVRATANILAHQLATITSEAELEDFQKHMNTVFNTTLSNFSAGFHSFVETLCSHQQTCQFWYEDITINSLVYMALFIAIRNGDWVLRMTAIKLMAAVFSAFDHPIYQRLVPQHFTDLLCFLAPILQHLQKGAISVHLTKSRGHAVGLDEAHEMKINKDAKFFFVVQPSKELMEKISNFIPFHSKCLNNLKHHLAMDEKTPKTLPVSTSRDHTAEVNIQSMLDLMEECDMLPTSPDNLGLLNNLSNTPATPEQAHDLLNFHNIGQAEFEAHVNYCILRTPSNRRRKHLQTFTSTKAARKKLKQIDTDWKIQQMWHEEAAGNACKR